jgi:proliferating cell nuclear antigen
MFKAVLNDPGILKSSFNAIASIVGEVQIQANKEGLTLDALDKSHIVFVHLELKPSLFDVYQCDEPLKLNIDTEELIDVLKRAKKDDTIELGSDEYNLILVFEGEAKTTFNIRLIDSEYESPSPPELDYPVEVGLPFNLLKDAVKDVEIVSNKIIFNVDTDKVIISGEGEFGDVWKEYVHGEDVQDQDVVVRGSLEKIKEVTRADKFFDTVSLQLGNDMPLNFILKMPADEGELSFLIAPRIESEEE